MCVDIGQILELGYFNFPFHYEVKLTKIANCKHSEKIMMIFVP
jgi:hypothetical protein